MISNPPLGFHRVCSFFLMRLYPKFFPRMLITKASFHGELMLSMTESATKKRGRCLLPSSNSTLASLWAIRSTLVFALAWSTAACPITMSRNDGFLTVPPLSFEPPPPSPGGIAVAVMQGKGVCFQTQGTRQERGMRSRGRREKVLAEGQGQGRRRKSTTVVNKLRDRARQRGWDLP